MAVVYEEMEKQHHTIAPIVTIQTHSKERVAMLKEAMTTLDKIHEWYEKYPEAPARISGSSFVSKCSPEKNWLKMQRGCWLPTGNCSAIWNQ